MTTATKTKTTKTFNAATYSTRYDDTIEMTEIFRNGKSIGHHDEDMVDEVIAENQEQDRAEHNEKIKDRIADLLETCEDTEKLEAILKMLKSK